MLLEDTALLYAAEYELVNILQPLLLDLLLAVGREVTIAFHTNDANHLALVEATELVAQPRTELEDNTAAFRDQLGNGRFVCLEADKILI